jgi:hypothetical protein
MPDRVDGAASGEIGPERVMKPINIILAAVSSCMAISLVLGIASSLLHSRTLKNVAVLSLAVGVGISLLPLTAFGIYSAYAWLRGRRPSRK